MRKAPACHTHSDISVWPPAAAVGYFNEKRSMAIAHSGGSLDQGEGTLRLGCSVANRGVLLLRLSIAGCWQGSTAPGIEIAAALFSRARPEGGASGCPLHASTRPCRMTRIFSRAFVASACSAVLKLIGASKLPQRLLRLLPILVCSRLIDMRLENPTDRRPGTSFSIRAVWHNFDCCRTSHWD